jgi:hypothetical protein
MFDLAKLRAAHDRVIRRTEQLAWSTLEKAAPEAQKHVRDHAQFTHRTGTALARTKARAIRLKRGGKIIVSNAARHAKFLEHGTRPHVIRARRARYLRFFWRKVGRLVFFKSVNHPGTRPYKFLERATHHVGDRVRLRLSRGMQRIARGF